MTLYGRLRFQMSHAQRVRAERERGSWVVVRRHSEGNCTATS